MYQVYIDKNGLKFKGASERYIIHNKGGYLVHVAQQQ